MTYRRLGKTAFRDALTKGLGRALLATRATRRLIDEDAALDACLHNRSYDPQLEGSRASWMMEILEASDSVDRFQAQILGALSSSADTWDLDQLCDFAEMYARRGVEAARPALYRVWHREPDISASWMAEEQIISLDGLDGFLYLAEQHGAAIRRGDDDFDCEALVRYAERHYDTDTVASVLKDAAARSPDLRAFREQAQKEREALEANGPGHADRMAAITAEQVIASVESPAGPSAGPYPSSWGRYAKEESLRTVASRLLLEREPAKLVKYLKIFARVPFPASLGRLLILSSHPDEGVSHWALQALAENRSSMVRNLALQRMEAGQRDRDTIALLKCNYLPGDHRLIEAALADCADADQMHWLCWEAEDVFRHNQAPRGAKSMRFAYAHTPCSLCRDRVVALLIKLKKMPAKLVEECRCDANHDIREQVAAGS